MTKSDEALAWIEDYSAIIYAILLVFATVAMTGMLVFAWHFSQENRHRIQDIQAEREFAAKFTCEDINQRHDATLKLLDKKIREAIALQPKRRNQLRQSQEFTVLLIDALVPKRNCNAYVKTLVPTKDGEKVKQK